MGSGNHDTTVKFMKTAGKVRHWGGYLADIGYFCAGLIEPGGEGTEKRIG